MTTKATNVKWLLSCAAAAAAIGYNAIASYNVQYLAVALLVALFFLAVALSRDTQSLNHTIAAETIVAIGIFSLVVSLAGAIYRIQPILSNKSNTSFIYSELAPLGGLFFEGLIAAAVAPLLATMLRNIDGGENEAESAEPDLAEAAKKAKHLAKELDKAGSIIGTLNEGLLDQVEVLKKAATSAASATTGLVEALKNETERLKIALQRVQAELGGLSDASAKGREAVVNLGGSMGAASTSAKEARELLDALGKLIDSVERFGLLREKDRDEP